MWRLLFIARLIFQQSLLEQLKLIDILLDENGVLQAVLSPYTLHTLHKLCNAMKTQTTYHLKYDPTTGVFDTLWCNTFHTAFVKIECWTEIAAHYKQETETS